MKKSSILFKWQFRNMQYILLLPFSFHTPEKNVFLLQQKTVDASYDHAMTTNRFPWSCTTTFICIVISSDLYILRKIPKSYLDDSQKILFCKGFLLSFDCSTPLGTIFIKNGKEEFVEMPSKTPMFQVWCEALLWQLSWKIQSRMPYLGI